MELKDILSKCDHTLLAQTATWDEIRAICDDGMKYGCASVCIPARYHRCQVLYGCRRCGKRRRGGGHGHQHRLGEG